MLTFNDTWRSTGCALLLAAWVGMLVIPQAKAQEIAPGLRAVPSALLSIDQHRSTVVDRIIADWGDTLTKANAGITVDQLRSTLMTMRSDYLLAASVAGSLDGLRSVVASSFVGSTPVSGKTGTKILGDTADDLVYTPVTPCREVDTRNAGGQIGSNSSRDFKVWVSAGGFTAQGGSATNCNIPANPVAVVVNLTAVSPAGAGNFIAYPTGTPTFTSVLNYQSGQGALANGAIVPVCQPSCPNQLTVATNGAGADLVMDIVGYFMPPVATAVDCRTDSASVTIPAAGATTQISATATCAAGYMVTGGGCTYGDANGNTTASNAVLINRDTRYFDGVNFTNQWSCGWTNTDAVNAYKGFARAVCCRVPGR